MDNAVGGLFCKTAYKLNHNNEDFRMPRRPAIDALTSHRDGAFLDELTTELNELIRAIRKTDKAGSLTIKLSINPIGGDAQMVTMKDKITSSMPELEKPSTLFYTTVEANMQKNNPSQPDLHNLREVEAEQTPVVIGDQETGAKDVG
jgi:hypothetical protein